ncbi:ribosome recycling factor [Gloeobacter kilaueensis JS1]|uniref:Ribosome-recycling factor n=2 Tax=Gloeobacter TaxID=33071 RepID=U5QJ67_GLOK1|nr:ribosome recycling factor [Gloeobacter kilaueensis]AGY58903.1 ribosome recycling factor [Gloeobacter kilaueensis JS1]
MKTSETDQKMRKAIEATSHNFATVRTGRASTALLDRITVEYYGSPTPLKTLATITTPDASTVLIQPYDPSSIRLIEKAILESDLSLPPSNDGKAIRLNIPPLTAERRKELVKVLARLAEEGRVAVRNIRREAIEEVRREEKDAKISEDESRRLQDEVQKLTDKSIQQIEKLLEAKEKEVTTV